MVQKLEWGRYTVTDVSSGLALDLSAANDGTLHAWSLYRGTRQQWDFLPCGEGFILGGVHSSGLFVTVRDLKGLHWGGSAQALAAAFPTCWDVEILAPGAVDTEPGDVLVRILLPYVDGVQMTLGFRDSHQEAHAFLGTDISTFWRLRPVGNRHDNVSGNTLITTNRTVVEGGGVTNTVITTVTTTTKTVTQVVPGED